eukprot:3060563-Amphidinium_carterae.1
MIPPKLTVMIVVAIVSGNQGTLPGLDVSFDCSAGGGGGCGATFAGSSASAVLMRQTHTHRYAHTVIQIRYPPTLLRDARETMQPLNLEEQQPA